MSTDFIDTTPIVEETFKSLQISSTSQSVAISEEIQKAVFGDFILNGSVECLKVNGETAWRVHIIPEAHKEEIAQQGDWLVVSSYGPLYVYTDAEHTAKFNPPQVAE